jgi:hypothetical protein
MATRIIEYNSKDVRMPVIDTMSVTEQTPLTATGTSAQSAALNAATNLVCVQSDEAVYVKLGESPIATTACYRLQAGGEQFFRVPQGAAYKVAVRT